MGIDNPVHLIFIAAVALIVLGPKRLPDLARSLGQGMKEFRDSMSQGAEGADHDDRPDRAPAGAARGRGGACGRHAARRGGRRSRGSGATAGTEHQAAVRTPGRDSGCRAARAATGVLTCHRPTARMRSGAPDRFSPCA